MKIICTTEECSNKGIEVDVFLEQGMNKVVICCCGQVFTE